MQITNRTTHPVQQGTGPWLRLREGYCTASEAPAALGVSRYVTRSDLLRRKFTGVAEEHDDATLGRFAAGHAAEAKARPLAEEIVSGDFYPVTMTCEVEGLRLLASCDGLTIDGSVAWETKLWNEDLAHDVAAGTLSPHYTVQMDQIMLVTGAERCLFTCTDGEDRLVYCWYERDEAKLQALIDGWHAFLADLARYELPTVPAPDPVGRAPETLPALRIEISGQVTASNLAEFRETALAAIRGVNRELRTDVHFADAEKAVKWCSEVEARIKAAKDHALSQTASIDALFRTLDDIAKEAREVRLDLDKLVARRKQEIKEQEVAKARGELLRRIATLNAELAPFLLVIPADWSGAIKGLRSIASLQDALDRTLAHATLHAEAQARKIRANAATYQRIAEQDFAGLFPDLGQLVHKESDDFAAVLHQRIAQHRIAEEARESARKKAAEEAARVAAEEAARVAAEEAARVAAEAAARAAAAASPSVPVDPAPPTITQQTAAIAPAAPADEPATLKLGDICGRLGVTMTAAFIETTLGIKPADHAGRAVLYRPSDYRRICAALIEHITIASTFTHEEIAA